MWTDHIHEFTCTFHNTGTNHPSFSQKVSKEANTLYVPMCGIFFQEITRPLQLILLDHDFRSTDKRSASYGFP